MSWRSVIESWRSETMIRLGIVKMNHVFVNLVHMPYMSSTPTLGDFQMGNRNGLNDLERFIPVLSDMDRTFYLILLPILGVTDWFEMNGRKNDNKMNTTNHPPSVDYNSSQYGINLLEILMLS